MATDHQIFDIIIVGAGPAGSTAALYASRFGLKALLLEKESFPRDKICGDAISGKSMTILKDLNLLEEVKGLPGASIDTITFGSPDHQQVNIRLFKDKTKGLPTGLVIRRKIFDQFLFSKAKMVLENIVENCTVSDLLFENDSVVGLIAKLKGGEEKQFRGKIILGADGFRSIVARKSGLYHHDPEHWIIALRQYYQNIKDLNSQIELHYVDEIQPGYLWIFPVEEGMANVGIGMHYNSLKKRKVDLKNAMKKALSQPPFAERFRQAVALEEPKGWNLPVGSLHRKCYGNGFMLLGDAAGLIDPFSGEGIGNAMFSARTAVKTAQKALIVNDFSAQTLSEYDRELWAEIGDELALGSKLQKIGRNRFLINFVINKAARNPEIQEILSGMMANQIPKTRLANPFFYLKLFLSVV